MGKKDTREAILDNGARLVHAKGFTGTGLQEILDASGVPKGSFYFYFKSKEDFGQALVDHYASFIAAMLKKYLEDPDIPPLSRMRRFFEDSAAFYKKSGFSGGCPIGNLSQEMSGLSEPMRKKLKDAYSRMKAALGSCVAEARERGDIAPELDPGNLATFILNGWEGALIDMKLTRSVDPLAIFADMLFGIVLVHTAGKKTRRGSPHGGITQ